MMSAINAIIYGIKRLMLFVSLSGVLSLEVATAPPVIRLVEIFC